MGARKKRSSSLKPKREHGGSLSVGKRRSYRAFNPKLSLHVTLKSDFAVGPRSLFRHKKLILSILRKNQLRFNVKAYTYALAGNHLHLLIKGQTREDIQNFFRVFAGHIAQRILIECPLVLKPGGAPQICNTDRLKCCGLNNHATSILKFSGGDKVKEGCKKNQRKFWKFLIYSRVVTWGREFKRVCGYIEKNVLETLHLIAYEPRLHNRKLNSS